MKYLMAGHQPENGTALAVQLDTHWFEFPAMEPVEIESDFYAGKIIEVYGHIYGIVEVPYTKSRTGINVNIDEAQSHARAHLRATENQMVLNWVQQQKEDRVRQNLPVLPPTGRVAEVIKRDHIDLQKRFGITPIGMDMNDFVDHEKENLRAQLAATQKELADTRASQSDLDARLAAIEESMTKGQGKGK